MKKTLQSTLTKAGLRYLLQELQAETTLSYTEISRRTGVHFTTIYGILRESAGDNRKKVHISTVRKLADNLGYKLDYFPRTNRVTLTPGKKRILHQTKRSQDPLDKFGLEIAQYIRGLGKADITVAERRKVKGIIKVLLI